MSLNYQGVGIRVIPGNFPRFHPTYPEKVMLNTGTASALGSRSEYQFPVPGLVSAPARTGVGGDPSDFDPIPSPERNAFSGLCLAIVRARPGATDTITVWVASK